MKSKILVFILLLSGTAVFAQNVSDSFNQLYFIFRNCKAMEFKVNALRINYNSFDHSVQTDTNRESCHVAIIRMGEKLQVLKTVPKGSIFIPSDSCAYRYSNGKVYKTTYDVSNGITSYHMLAPETFRTLPYLADSLLYDSIYQSGKNVFNLVYLPKDDLYQSFYTEQKYTYSHSGHISSFIQTIESSSLLPHFYTIEEYGNFIGCKQVSKELFKKFKPYQDSSEFKYQQTLLKLSKNDTVVNYKRQTQSTELYNMELYRRNEVVSIDSLIKSNKLSLLYFWFDGCMPCRRVKPELMRIYETYQANGLELVGINAVDDSSSIYNNNQPFFSTYDKGRLSLKLQIKGAPILLLINSKGEILGQIVGYLPKDLAAMEAHIRELLE